MIEVEQEVSLIVVSQDQSLDIRHRLLGVQCVRFKRQASQHSFAIVIPRVQFWFKPLNTGPCGEQASPIACCCRRSQVTLVESLVVIVGYPLAFTLVCGIVCHLRESQLSATGNLINMRLVDSTFSSRSDQSFSTSM
jgi:hypothetical protein